MKQCSKAQWRIIFWTNRKEDKMYVNAEAELKIWKICFVFRLVVMRQEVGGKCGASCLPSSTSAQSPTNNKNALARSWKAHT
tara:strand:+ start:1171 stop:1416 length:246 start_codon:yes stop_codon:yes gene_type:complete